MIPRREVSQRSPRMPARIQKRGLVFHMQDLDLRCAAYIADRYRQSGLAGPVRISLAGQAERSADDRDAYESLAASCRSILDQRRDGVRTRKYHIAFRADESEMIDRLRKAHGLASRSAAVRFALRAQAAEDGMSLSE